MYNPNSTFYVNVGILRHDQSSTSFVDYLCYFSLAFVMLSCASVYCCLVVTCWERADLLALVCDV